MILINLLRQRQIVVDVGIVSNRTLLTVRGFTNRQFIELATL